MWDSKGAEKGGRQDSGVRQSVPSPNSDPERGTGPPCWGCGPMCPMPRAAGRGLQSPGHLHST